MKKETGILIYSVFNNLFIVIFKIFGGFTFQLNSLFADGIHTLSDFVTDIVSLICSKISFKRPTKYHPFGFGKVSYLSNLFIGIILLGISLFIFINSFFVEYHTPPLNTLYLLILVLLLKFIAIFVIYKYVHKYKSILLLTNLEESKTDLYSTILVILITIFMQFSSVVPLFQYSDLIGTIVISFMILNTGVEIIKENAMSIIGEAEKNEELQDKVNELLNDFSVIKDKKIEFIKYGSYYRLNLTLQLDDNLKLKNIVKLQKKIKYIIVKHYSLKIKYVNISVTDEI